MKLNILFGGASFEHEISIVSAVTLKEKLKSLSPKFIFCDQDHTLYLIKASEMNAKLFSSGGYKKMPKLEFVMGAFRLKRLFSHEDIKGLVLNLIHGADGEDGTIAALLDFYSIRYIGPRIDASIFSFDKKYTKLLCKAKNIKTLEYEVLEKNIHKDVKLAYPIIVKPARLGSSLGVSVVRDESELDYALDVAYEFDTTLLVEPFIEGVKEYNLAGYLGKNGMRFSIVEEPQKSQFLDFEKKYLDFSRSAQVLKAPISEALEAKLQKTFEKIYRGMFEGALIRCDFFVINNEVYLNEINPIPGSMANYLFDDFVGAIDELSNALPHAKRVRINYNYIHSINAAKGK